MKIKDAAVADDGSLSTILVYSARRAAEKSYSPYSKFRVGAALMWPSPLVIGESGKQVTTRNYTAGTNVENASYGLTICAERAAIFAAVREGMRPGQLKALAVTCPDVEKEPGFRDLVMPCGACRQVIAEFADPSVFRLYVDGLPGPFAMADILPNPFRLAGV